jgi:glycine dehydrogenase subunit 1
LREVCEQNIQKTAYAARQIEEKTRHKILFPGPRFNEFVVQLQDDASLEARSTWSGILPGVPLKRVYPELGNALLTCVTETASREQIDGLVDVLK